nr:hypothetical protein [Spirochaeta sp.]
TAIVPAQVPEQRLERGNDDPPGLSYISLGGRAGWGELETSRGAAFARGWRGGDDIVLADQAAAQAHDTDLFAGFDRSANDVSGRYRVGPVDRVRHITHAARFGGGALAFDGQSALALYPLDGSIFTPYATSPSFSIDIWLYPTGTREGTEILRWNGAFLAGATPTLQSIRFHIDQGLFRWDLRNVVARFDGENREMTSVSLSGRRGPVPQRWTHHRLRYDAGRGQLTYLVDGVPAAITYITESGREDNRAYALIFGDDTGDGLVLGRGYHGVIDELRIERAARSDLRIERYDGSPAEIITAPIQLGPGGGSVYAVRPRTETPGNTDVRVYYRVGNRTTGSEWIELDRSGETPAAPAGSYIQIRSVLLPDASADRTPRLQAVEIAYEPHSAPPTPRRVRGTSVPAGVTVEWEPVMTDRSTEYRVLFGEHPGRYTGAHGVRSPVRITDGTTAVIDGLEPDRSYVFAVESVDQYGQRSALSREIEVRAGRVRR